MQGLDPRMGLGSEPIPMVLGDRSGCERSVWVGSFTKTLAQRNYSHPMSLCRAFFQRGRNAEPGSVDLQVLGTLRTQVFHLYQGPGCLGVVIGYPLTSSSN